MSAVGAMHDSRDAERRDAVGGRVKADLLVGDQLFAGDNDVFGGNSHVDVVELVALDHAGAVGRGFLNMDNGGVKLGNRQGDNLLAGVEGVVNINELIVG